MLIVLFFSIATLKIV